MAINLGLCLCFSGMIGIGWRDSGLAMVLPAPVGLAPATNRVALLAVTRKPSTGLPRFQGNHSLSRVVGLFAVCSVLFFLAFSSARSSWAGLPTRMEHDGRASRRATEPRGHCFLFCRVLLDFCCRLLSPWRLGAGRHPSDDYEEDETIAVRSRARNCSKARRCAIRLSGQ